MTWNDAIFMMPEIVLTVAASLLLLAPVSGFRESEWSAKWATLFVLAVTAELPSAAVCLLIARHVEEVAERAQRYALVARLLRPGRRRVAAVTTAEVPAETG